MLIGLNTALALGAGLDLELAGIGPTTVDILGLAVAALMCALLVGEPRRGV